MKKKNKFSKEESKRVAREILALEDKRTQAATLEERTEIEKSIEEIFNSHSFEQRFQILSFIEQESLKFEN